MRLGKSIQRTSVFIDEMGIQLSLCRTHARSPKGQRAYGSKPYSRGKNVSVIGAIALKGFLGCMTLEGTTNGDAFQVFVEKVLLNCLWPGAVVVMDNLSAHNVTLSWRGTSNVID